MCYPFHCGKNKNSACGKENILKFLFVVRLTWLHKSFQILTFTKKFISEFHIEFEIQTFKKNKFCSFLSKLDISEMNMLEKNQH